MLRAVGEAKRVIQRGSVQYDPNIFKLLIIHKNGWERGSDESDEIEKLKSPLSLGGNKKYTISK